MAAHGWRRQGGARVGGWRGGAFSLHIICEKHFQLMSYFVLGVFVGMDFRAI